MEFDFPESVESIDKVPEQFRPVYTEGENGFQLNESYKGIAEAVTGLNKSLKAARAEAKNAKGKQVDLTPLSDFGETPEEIHQNIQAQIEELQQQASKGKDIDPEKIKADLAKGFTKERDQLTTRNQALQNQLYSLLVENSATQAVAEEKGIPELLMPFIKNQTKTVEEDGEFRVYVTDEQGDVRYSGITGEPMTIKELVKEMKGNERFGRLFESEAPSGGGTPPGAPARRQPQGKKELSSNEKISAGLNHRMR